MKKKTARRWLNRNSWKIAKLRLGFFKGRGGRFVAQFLRCLKAVK